MKLYVVMYDEPYESSTPDCIFDNLPQAVAAANELKGKFSDYAVFEYELNNKDDRYKTVYETRENSQLKIAAEINAIYG